MFTELYVKPKSKAGKKNGITTHSQNPQPCKKTVLEQFRTETTPDGRPLWAPKPHHQAERSEDEIVYIAKIKAMCGLFEQLEKSNLKLQYRINWVQSEVQELRRVKRQLCQVLLSKNLTLSSFANDFMEIDEGTETNPTMEKIIGSVLADSKPKRKRNRKKMPLKEENPVVEDTNSNSNGVNSNGFAEQPTRPAAVALAAALNAPLMPGPSGTAQFANGSAAALQTPSGSSAASQSKAGPYGMMHSEPGYSGAQQPKPGPSRQSNGTSVQNPMFRNGIRVSILSQKSPVFSNCGPSSASSAPPPSHNDHMATFNGHHSVSAPMSVEIPSNNIDKLSPNSNSTQSGEPDHISAAIDQVLAEATRPRPQLPTKKSRKQNLSQLVSPSQRPRSQSSAASAPASTAQYAQWTASAEWATDTRLSANSDPAWSRSPTANSQQWSPPMNEPHPWSPNDAQWPANPKVNSKWNGAPLTLNAESNKWSSVPQAAHWSQVDSRSPVATPWSASPVPSNVPPTPQQWSETPATAAAPLPQQHAAQPQATTAAGRQWNTNFAGYTDFSRTSMRAVPSQSTLPQIDGIFNC